MAHSGKLQGSGNEHPPDGRAHARWLGPPRHRDGTWHSKLTGGPSVLFRNGQVLLWFFGSERDDFSFVYFGLATADKQTF